MKSILIVDDDLMVLKSLARTFKNEPYKMFYAADPQEALSLFKNKEFDVVVSDYKMPSMTGVKFLEKVLEISPQTRCILQSGYSVPDTAIKAFNKNIIHKFLQKPWDSNSITELVKKQVSIVEENEEGIWVKSSDEFLERS